MKKIIFFFVLGIQTLLAQKSLITVTDLTRINQIGDIVVSPENNMAVYVVKKVVPKLPDYEYQTQIMGFRLANENEHFELTQGSSNASQPQFAGNQLIFTKKGKEKNQIFVMPLSGGEPYQLTDNKYGVSQFKVSPDGQKIIYTSSISLSEMLLDSTLNPTKKGPIWNIEKPGKIVKSNAKANPDGDIDQIRAYLSQDEKDKKAKVINRLNFQGEATTEPDILFKAWFLMDLKKGATAKLLSPLFYSYEQMNWKNNQEIVFVTDADPTQHPDRAYDQKIVLKNLSDNMEKTLFVEKGKSVNGLTVENGEIYFVRNESEKLSYGEFCKLNGEKVEVLDFDRIPNQIKSFGNRTLITASSNGGVPIFELTKGKFMNLTDYQSGIGDLEWLNKDEIIYVKNDINTPAEIFIYNFQTKKERAITQLNDWVNQKYISLPEKGSFKNSKGQTIDYWIMKPTQMEAGKKYPLLPQMHGGPTAMWGPGESSMWHEFQFFAAKGYGIVYLNQRGSGGYGKDFQLSNYRDWGAGPAEDALTACTLAAKQAWADTSQQFITGGSYAGYLTAYIVGHDHRFKAAVAQRGVYDLTTFMGEGNAWRLTPYYFGYPWESEDITKIKANSPYTFVKNIQTPLLIKHGETDLRTGVIQSEMLYKSMKILNKNVEYVRMPGAAHELSRSGDVRQRIDRILRIYEFFERY